MMGENIGIDLLRKAGSAILFEVNLGDTPHPPIIQYPVIASLMIGCLPDRSSAKVLEGLARWTRRASAMRDYTLTKQSKRAVLTSDQLFLPFQETHWKPIKNLSGERITFWSVETVQFQT